MASYNYNEVDRRRNEVGNFLIQNGCSKSSIMDHKGGIAYDWKLNCNELKKIIQKLKPINPTKELITGYTAGELIDIFELWIEQSENGITDVAWY